MKNIIIIIFTGLLINACGKVGPLSLPEDKLDKSVITYPCDADCMAEFEAEKKRQKSVTIQSE